jgi:hypothetical protein
MVFSITFGHAVQKSPHTAVYFQSVERLPEWISTAHSAFLHHSQLRDLERRCRSAEAAQEEAVARLTESTRPLVRQVSCTLPLIGPLHVLIVACVESTLLLLLRGRQELLSGAMTGAAHAMDETARLCCLRAKADVRVRLHPFSEAFLECCSGYLLAGRIE